MLIHTHTHTHIQIHQHGAYTDVYALKKSENVHTQIVNKLTSCIHTAYPTAQKHMLLHTNTCTLTHTYMLCLQHLW